MLPITSVKYDKIHLEDLWAPHGTNRYKLKNSVGVKALKGISDENEGYRKSHHIGQSDTQRLLGSLESIKKHGYPYEDQYIILFGDNNIIFDGQHRASCLYYLYGNIEVPVMRIYSSKINSIKRIEPRIWNDWIIYSIYTGVKSTTISFFVLSHSIIKRVYRKVNSIFHSQYRSIFSKRERKTNKDLDGLFNSK